MLAVTSLISGTVIIAEEALNSVELPEVGVNEMMTTSVEAKDAEFAWENDSSYRQAPGDEPQISGVQRSSDRENESESAATVETVTTSAAENEEQEPQADKQPPQSTESYVREYFSDIPIMAEIARCESTFRHYNTTGTPLRGVVNSNDVGVMQINENYHLEQSRSLGYDIYSRKGNLKYARHLYETQGTTPWRASKPCWDPEYGQKVAHNN